MILRRIIVVLLLLLPNSIFPQKIEDVKYKIEAIFSDYYQGKNIKTKVIGIEISNKRRTATIRKLAIKVDGIIFGNLVSDNLTIIYDNILIDLSLLLKQNQLRATSYSNIKANILVSTSNFEQTVQRKLSSLGKQNIKTLINFSPPWIECKYKIPKNQLSHDTKSMIFKYLIGETLEGYFALRISIKNSQLYGRADKVILNHFLIPQSLVRTFEGIYNPFDEIPIIQPFGIKIKELIVQENYILFSN